MYTPAAEKKNKLGGSPLFPGIYSGPCRFLYLGEIERRSEATQKVKKKKKKTLPPSPTKSSIWRVSPEEPFTVPSVVRGSLFPLFSSSHSLPFPPPQVALPLPHNNILSLTHLSSFPILSPSFPNQIYWEKKKMEKRNRRRWYMLYKKIRRLQSWK